MMINVSLLKKRVLDLAFRGQLTEHHENESSIELLPKLFNNKKKKYISFSPDFAGFEIPSNWNWCMTYQAVSLDNGDETSGEKLPYLEVKFLRTGKDPKIINSGVIVDKGEKLILVDGENSGEVFLANERGYKGSTLKILNISDAFIEKYIFLFIYSYKEGFRKNKTGAAIPHLDKKRLFETPLPIPPLEEQKRIVAKLDEMFAELDKIDEKQTRLAAIQEKMEAKILKLAIQGKLVEQRPEEGTGDELFKLIQQEKQELIKQGKIKKEKPLPAIEDVEIPFAIPSTWKWVRLGDLGNYKKGPFGSSLTKSMFVPKSEDSIKVYEQKNAIQKNWNIGTYYIEKKYYESDMKGFTLLPGDIIVSCAGTIGETYVIPNEAEIGIINQALMRMRIMKSVNIDYFLIYFDFILKGAANDKGKGTAIKNIPPFDILKNMLVPLPPFNEQKRIVAKIEELLPLCRGN